MPSALSCSSRTRDYSATHIMTYQIQLSQFIWRSMRGWQGYPFTPASPSPHSYCTFPDNNSVSKILRAKPERRSGNKAIANRGIRAGIAISRSSVVDVGRAGDCAAKVEALSLGHTAARTSLDGATSMDIKPGFSLWWRLLCDDAECFGSEYSLLRRFAVRAKELVAARVMHGVGVQMESGSLEI